MALETDLQKMAEHIAFYLEQARDEIKDADGHAVFAKAEYGEPRVITAWPFCSVQPTVKDRILRQGATRKFRIEFDISIFLYHGEVADTMTIQAGTHKRAEALDLWFGNDYKWNFVDTDDPTKDKVIFGYVTRLDHPIVVAREGQLWSASRLELTAISEETF